MSSARKGQKSEVRCKRCQQKKKGCTGGRPCDRCKSQGIVYAGCVPENQDTDEEVEDENEPFDLSRIDTSLFPAIPDRIPRGVRTGRMLFSASNFPEGELPSIEQENNNGQDGATVGDSDDNLEEGVVQNSDVVTGEAEGNDMEGDGMENSGMDEDDQAIYPPLMTAALGKLPMVHYSHLTWRDDRILWNPRTPSQDESVTAGGCIDPAGTHRLIYEYGGPAYTVTAGAKWSDGNDTAVQHLDVDVMVCMKDYCSICSTGQFRPPVPAAKKSRYGGRAYVHISRDCHSSEDGALIFSQKAGEVYNTALNGTSVAQVQFHDGQQIVCCVCLAPACSFCGDDPASSISEDGGTME